jgi:uncharacterized protein (DUF4415 family)
MDEAVTEKTKRKGRGPGKRPALVSTSIRLTREVMNYFNEHHPHDKQAQMRAVLTEYVRDELKLKEPQNGTQETVDE